MKKIRKVDVAERYPLLGGATPCGVVRENLFEEVARAMKRQRVKTWEKRIMGYMVQL